MLIQDGKRRREQDQQAERQHIQRLQNQRFEDFPLDKEGYHLPPLEYWDTLDTTGVYYTRQLKINTR